ncbi:4245_t:CDS:2 [Entrophospora sp. SA101]|nr:1684_t:CDS:2 [Entrophospora sp. SA101]CAJ0748011.1 4245_t:CDS:2 [Entrophospora sp. SA101]CAJ0825716.1 1244_t:CDS:2 [Entrophospora sp. SA101]
MGEVRDRVFELGSESISDGLPFFQLGYIKGDTHEGLRIVCQNRKGFNLNNPYLRVVNFHQKVFRVYTVKGYVMNDPRRFLVSGNHPVYHPRNLPSDDKTKLHYSFCDDLKNNVSLMCPVIDPIAKKAVGITPFPKLSLFKIDTNFASNFWNSFSGSNIRELEGINFVDDLVIKKVEGTSLSDALNGAFMAFIAPHDFADDNVKKDGTRNYYYDEIKGTATFAENNGQK